MLKEKMYVRCPADYESVTDPRVFVCGQIIEIDNFKNIVLVKVNDPFKYALFFEDMPTGIIEEPINAVVHCSLFQHSEVIARGEVCTILTGYKSKDEFYYYYVESKKNKKIFCISEENIIASFSNGDIDPATQLINYEFQNPCWFYGHAVVSRNMNILDNSIYGFKELAGAKIYLFPHQVNTIMRCLSEHPCRFMLADEVGMGKTVEAISVLKIYLQKNANKKALIIVPDTLKQQWETELLLKFNISIGEGKDNNRIFLNTFSEMDTVIKYKQWDFVIVDEVHKYITESKQYNKLHYISLSSENILLLSATPVQQRREEYLKLLRLLQPSKYDLYNVDYFNKMINKQSHIIQKTALILDDLEDYEEEINKASDLEGDPHESEDCIDLFEEIYDEIESVCNELKDAKLSTILDKIAFNDEGFGVYEMKIIISYICGNYQIESNIIRNRRKIFENNDNGKSLPTRELKKITYSLDKDKNNHEAVCYQLLTDWILKIKTSINIENMVIPLLEAFFSSPWAFISQLDKIKAAGVPVDLEIIKEAQYWLNFEKYILDNIVKILDDPPSYETEYCTRLLSILNLIYDDLYDQKMVIFTNYTETFFIYKRALETIFAPEEISFFGAGMDSSDMELNAYRFQNESTCRIMLCDSTGGEGRNFQCADYIVNIDLPWDANAIEQRIGRLDRLERDPLRFVVTSIVIYAEDTFEEALFDFWNNGLNIFKESLSGMEIIMNDINHEIINAIDQDFKYGLFERIPKIIELANNMKETVRKEQNYDAASLMYRPMFVELKKLVDYYNQNENTLFANTMKNWASLAGFRGQRDEKGTITYTAKSFVPKSAINSQLIPPHWNDYMSSGQNRFVNKVQENYDKRKSIQNQGQFIRGTFLRKSAIENDYLHFFAPGDEIFDCIVNNAINSCKGNASAFAVLSDVNWKGLIFTWSIFPNEVYLLEKGISVYALGPYRTYLTSPQVTIPIGIENPESISDSDIVRIYNRTINEGFIKSKIVHLGKRSLSSSYLKEEIIGSSNVSWFKSAYPEEIWSDIIKNARKDAQERALKQFSHQINIKRAKEEMERELSARIANSIFYDEGDKAFDELKREQEILLKAITRPRLILDSVAYIWMVKKENG